jgi:ketosteroid isomerase-like protein
MAHPNADLASRLHLAIVSADLDAMRELFAPDVIWHVAGRGPLAADYQGIGAVLDLFGRLYDMADGTLAYDVHDVVADDVHAVVLLTVRASIAGRDLADKAAHVCHVLDGRVSEVWAYHWDQRGIDEAMTEDVVRSAREH